MMLNILVLCVCLLNLSLIANAIDDGMKELKQWDKATKQVESVKMMAEKSCATEFDFSFDRESFLLETKLGELDNNAMNRYCGDAFTAINELCADADFYKTMGSVKSVSCAFDENVATPNAILEDGHLQFAFNWNTSNHQRTVKDYLKKNIELQYSQKTRVPDALEIAATHHLYAARDCY